MESRPEYIIYYLINRLKYLQSHRPSIFHVYHRNKSMYFVVSSERAANECKLSGYVVEKADLDDEILKISEKIKLHKLNKFILDSVN